LQEQDKYRACKALYPDLSVFSECLGHIQGYCKTLQKPGITVHYGIRRDVIMHFEKQLLEENKETSWEWELPTSVIHAGGHLGYWQSNNGIPLKDEVL